MKNVLRYVIIFLIVVLISGSVVLFRNNNTNNDSNNLDYSSLSYLAFGDSITYGIDGWTGNTREMTNPYPKLVAKELGFKKYSNKGKSGSTFGVNPYDYWVSMTDIVLECESTADIISVMGGVNDYSFNVPLGNVEDTDNSTLYGGLNVIAKTLLANNKNSFIFFMSPLGRSGGDTVNEQGYTMDDVATAVKVVANKYDIAFLDIYNLVDFSTEYNDENSDGIHPSQSFVKTKLVPQITQFIKENYK